MNATLSFCLLELNLANILRAWVTCRVGGGVLSMNPRGRYILCECYQTHNHYFPWVKTFCNLYVPVPVAVFLLLVLELFFNFPILIVFAFAAPGPKKQGESPENQDSVSQTSHMLENIDGQHSGWNIGKSKMFSKKYRKTQAFDCLGYSLERGKW